MKFFRRLTSMLFGRANALVLRWRGMFNYAREVGDVMDSSLVAATLLWVGRNFPEAPPILTPVAATGNAEPVHDHPMLRLLQQPNPYYSGSLLWMATVIEWMADGNGYWLKVRSQSGAVRELWWTPAATMDPRGTDSEFLSHYVYTPPGMEPVKIPPSEVVHFRYGLDPDNPRKGMSPLKSVLREVFTDNEAASFTASILRNMGVPGIVISPESNVKIPVDEAKKTKATLEEQFGGENRGKPIVLTGATKVQEFGFSPEQLLLKELRRVPEERVSAVTGIPAIVVGFGAGLDRSTFTNMGEALEYAYSNGLIPLQRLVSEDIRFQLLPEWEEDPFAWLFGFDLSKVRALKEDLYRQAQRLDLLYRGGAIMRSESRRPLGYEVDEERDNVFVLPLNTSLVHGDTGAVTAPAKQASSNGGANGAVARDVADEVMAAMDRRELLDKR